MQVLNCKEGIKYNFLV